MNPGNMSGARDDADINLAVQLPRIQRSDASRAGGQKESLHLIGTEYSESNSSTTSLGRSGAKEVSPQQHRRRSSLRFSKNANPIHHDPGTGFDNEGAKDEMRPADAALAVPQVNKEHASAARDPDDIAQ